MDQIILNNFRCFREEQTARLAPLTILVGENSTGKTSFLAIIRALWEFAYLQEVPDFKKEPYDLGSFDEIAHHRGGRGGRAQDFAAGFRVSQETRKVRHVHLEKEAFYRFTVTFGREGTAPIPIKRRLTGEDTWIEEDLNEGRIQGISFGTPRGDWHHSHPGELGISSFHQFPASPFSDSLSKITQAIEDLDTDTEDFALFNDREPPTTEDGQRFNQLLKIYQSLNQNYPKSRPYASAPVRSKPRRTYDPARPMRDPEGESIPMYLANMFFQNKYEWSRLKKLIEKFGQTSGLFDEISVKPLGKKESEPFQVQVRKIGSKSRGPRRNLIDVGYGVSQVLPVITELLRLDAPPMFLLQQPEVHLHPSAQAALGSLFCQVAGQDRQLVVETHSDHLLDRVRMDIRDSTTKLRPKDVSILFFERENLDVTVHSLQLDQDGNVLDAPESYRRFFMEETRRSLKL